MAITILDASADAQVRERFIGLPTSVYRDDPLWCAPMQDAVEAGLNSPTFAGAQRLFLAEDDGHPAARVCARRVDLLPDAAGKPYGALGFFEALDRPDAVRLLFRTALDWLRASGAGSVLGPIDGDTWHRYRVNIGPHDSPPFLMEPYNPRYYAALWEGSGFRPFASYCSKRVTDVSAVLSRFEPRARRVLRNGYQLRPLNPDRFEQELDLLYDLSCRTFSGNLFYTEIPRDEFHALYADVRSLLDPDLVWFARAPDGTDAGFVFALPDRFREVAAMRGGRGPLAKLRFHRNDVQAVNIKTLGVTPPYRRTGLASALMYQAYSQGLEKGYRQANLCLMIDGNASARMDAGLGEVFRRYVLYQFDEGARP